jgi:hypothetical protein
LELDIVSGARANVVEYDSTVNQFVLTMCEPTSYLKYNPPGKWSRDSDSEK